MFNLYISILFFLPHKIRIFQFLFPKKVHFILQKILTLQVPNYYCGRRKQRTPYIARHDLLQRTSPRLKMSGCSVGQMGGSGQEGRKRNTKAGTDADTLDAHMKEVITRVTKECHITYSYLSSKILVIIRTILFVY